MVIVTIHRSNNIKSGQSISYIIGLIYKAVPQLRRLTAVCVECQKFRRLQMSPPPARSRFEGITSVNTHTAVYMCVSLHLVVFWMKTRKLSAYAKMRLLFDIRLLDLCSCFIFQGVLHYANAFVYVS